MENTLLHLLNISITACYIIIAVILLRLILSKAPKWTNCLLWAVAGLRLILPFSVESILSLVPSANPIPNDIMLSPEPQINTGLGFVNSAVNPLIENSFTPDPAIGANPLQIFFFVAAWVWIIGICAMLLWGMISFLRIRKRVAPSICVRNNIYICDGIDTPFILGIFRPRIYLPSSLTESETAHIISHEKAHLSRWDHVWKPLGFLLLSVYWFNPLLWVAYILFCRDIEKACDERVIRGMTTKERQDYSSTLLSRSIKVAAISACPLAFGEVDVRARVKSILNYKKPAFWIIVVSLVAVVAVAVAFLTIPPSDLIDDPAPNFGNTDTDKMAENQKKLYEKYPEYFGLDASNGLDVYVWQMAKDHYAFGLRPHSEKADGWHDTELYKLKGATALEMRRILETYDVSRDEINIVPWQNPFSSYIADIWIMVEGEDATKKRAEYIIFVKDMLFDKVYLDPDNLMTFAPTFYDTKTFDVDGDGHDEVCTLAYGRTSGLFTFIFYAHDQNGALKYHTDIYSVVYDLSFKVCDDGVIRVQGIDQLDKAHLFDITVKDGNIYLYDENGQYIVDQVIMPITYPIS